VKHSSIRWSKIPVEMKVHHMERLFQQRDKWIIFASDTTAVSNDTGDGSSGKSFLMRTDISSFRLIFIIPNMIRGKKNSLQFHIFPLVHI
jgi:hypothetical protein